MTLDANGRVMALDLGGQDLRGEIPPELGALSHLRFLYLQRNNLRGEIPDELENLTNLKGLDLTDNNLTCVPAHLQKRWQGKEEFRLDSDLPTC